MNLTCNHQYFEGSFDNTTSRTVCVHDRRKMEMERMEIFVQTDIVKDGELSHIEML
jgi:hypothetical protein